MKKKILFPQVNGLIHGGDYNPDQWLDRPDILEKDIELMKKAHINSASIGIFAWSAYEPKEGEISFDWLIKVMDNLYANGIYTILATPSGARPVWLDQKYEECKRCDEYGNREYHKERHNHCMSSEVYREKVGLIDSKLAQAVKGHPGLILWHISNEFGGYCYCDKCKKKFQNWLEEKYETIDNLNHQWWTAFWSKKFTSFDQIDPPYKNGEVAIKGLILDWRRFQTYNATDFMNFEIDTVKAITPEIPVTTNMMTFFPEYDYRAMVDKLDVISWDAYPRFHNDYQSLYDTMQITGFTHSIMHTLIKQQPFMLMESTPSLPNWHAINKLKKPGVHALSSLQAIALGSDTVQYFQFRKSRGSSEQFHGAVVDHLGSDDTRVFKEVSALGATLEKIKEVNGTIYKSEAAILMDWDNRWAIWSTEAFVKDDKKYEETLYDLYGELTSKGLNLDIIGRNDDFSQYKVIYAPMYLIVNEKLADKIKEFVANGGVFVGGYMLGYTNENQLANLGGFPGCGLREVFGILNEEIDTLYPSQSNGMKFDDNNVAEIKDYCELVRLEGANVLASYTDDFYAGYPCVTVNNFGLGKAYYIAARTKNKDIDCLHKQILNDAKVDYCDLPNDVERHIRYGEEHNYIFYLNDSDQEKVIEDVTGYNIINDQQINGSLTLAKYEVAIIRV